MTRWKMEIRVGDMVALHPTWSEVRIHADIATIGSIEDDAGPPGVPLVARDVAVVTRIENLLTVNSKVWGRAVHVISHRGCGWIYYDYVAPVRGPGDGALNSSMRQKKS